jgi:hypothetical protein
LLDYLGNTDRLIWCKKITLATDLDLIADGVQAIDDEFLEWFVKNPSCENVKVESLNIGDGKLGYVICKPKEEPKQYFYCSDRLELDENERCVTQCNHCASKPKQRLEKYSERFDNDKSPIGNTETWGKRMVKETLEEAVKRIYPEDEQWTDRHIFNLGVKWQQERIYIDIEVFTEELKDKIDLFEYSVNQNSYISDYIKEWFEQFKNK